MGFNTTVLILNDSFDVLERHPDEFVAGIREKMNDGGDVSVANHVNPVHVMPTQHADVFRLYVTQGNGITELSPYSNDTLALARRMPELVKQYIEDARYNLDQLEATIKEIR